MNRTEALQVQACIQAGEKVDPEVMAEALCTLQKGCKARRLKLTGMTTGEQMDVDHALCGRLSGACAPQPKAA